MEQENGRWRQKVKKPHTGFSNSMMARSIFVLYNLERYPHFDSTNYDGSRNIYRYLVFWK